MWKKIDWRHIKAVPSRIGGIIRIENFSTGYTGGIKFRVCQPVGRGLIRQFVKKSTAENK